MGRPIWNVPHRQNPAFTGRGEVFAALRERLTGSGRTALAQAISGLGGIGKTQTAVEYAYRYRDQYQAVLWLNAESPLALKAGCGELARRMQLPHPEEDLDQAVSALKDWLETHSGWLLILDNADDPAMLGPFLRDAGQGHILLTSRAQDFQDLGILEPVELPKLPIEEATEFMLHRCGRQEAEERDAARELARELDGLPLALEQAAAYIHETKAPFRRYLDGYRRRGLALLQARGPALGGYPESVVSTWAANFDTVQEQSPAAADVLRFSAFLAPDVIPFELLARGAHQLGPSVQQALAGGPSRAESDQTEGLRSRPRANTSFLGRLLLLARLVFRRSRGVNPRRVESNGDPLLVHDLLRPLGRFSLARIDGHGETYSIHRLVQEVLKAAMDDATRHLWAERAVRAVDQAFPPVEYDHWPLCDRLLPHALAVASWIERDRPEFAEAGRLLNQTAFYLYDRGQYAEAEPLYKEAMEIHRTALGEEHPAYATSLNNLAVLYDAMGRHADAEPLYKQATEIRRTALGEEHPAYADSLNNLAMLYDAMGRHADAEPLYKQAMEIRRTALGEGHPAYADSLNNLAELYRAMGRHADAEPLYKQAMEIYRISLGERHPAYADSLNNLAELYRAMGRHADAEPLYKQATEIRRTALGEEHPAYADSLNNLAELYRAMGRHADAEPLYKQATEIRRTALGEEHPAYADSLNNLAELYRAMGRHADAEPLYKQAMEIYRISLGERHPAYADSLNNLAVLYRAMGRHADAEPLLLKAMEIRRTALGEEHPAYATSLNNLAVLYDAMGRHADAEPLYRQAVRILRAALGASHPTYRTVLTSYIANQQEGGLPLPDLELLEDFLASLPSLPPEAGEDDAGPEGLGP